MPGSVNAEESSTHSTTDEHSSRPRLAWRKIRRHATGRRLCALAGLALLGDLATTVYGLENGLREMNPVVATVLGDFGVAGLVGLKLLAVSWAVVIWVVLGRRYGIAAVLGLAIPQSVAVVLNLLAILTV